MNSREENVSPAPKLGQQHLSGQLKIQKSKARGKLMRYFSHYNRNGLKQNSTVELVEGELTDINEGQHTTISSNTIEGEKSTNAASNLGSAPVAGG